MDKYDENNNLVCSFCGKPQDKVSRLISGDGVCICDECIAACFQIIENENDAKNKEKVSEEKNEKLPTPREIDAILGDYVVGQERARKVLAVAVYNHYKRIQKDKKAEDKTVEVQKSNVIMIGPTGSGKTLLAETLAKILKVPFAIADATTLTEAGYVGDDVENILLRLIQAADYNIPKAEKGIIYIDEIEKIARMSENRSITRDVSGEGVQQALLKIIEGTVANVPQTGGRKHPGQEMIPFNTSDVLFICGGAFDGLDKIIKRRQGGSAIGFNASDTKEENAYLENLYADLRHEDLLHYGLIPEFIGRVPVKVSLDKLSETDLVKILTEPKNALVKQYEKLFKMDGVKLVFENSALIEIAREAISRNTGARGLRSIMEEALSDAMFEIPSAKNIEKCTVSRNIIEGKGISVNIEEKKRTRKKKTASA